MLCAIGHYLYCRGRNTNDCLHLHLHLQGWWTAVWCNWPSWCPTIGAEEESFRRWIGIVCFINWTTRPDTQVCWNQESERNQDLSGRYFAMHDAVAVFTAVGCAVVCIHAVSQAPSYDNCSSKASRFTLLSIFSLIFHPSPFPSFPFFPSPPLFKQKFWWQHSGELIVYRVHPKFFVQISQLTLEASVLQTLL